MRWRTILTEGLIAGVIGYAVVAVFFALANIVQGRPAIYTAALLGSHLFHGLRDPADLVVAPGPVLAYNGLHLAAFLAAGMFMAWLATVVERAPQAWYLGLILFLIVMPHVFGLPIWFGAAVRATLSLWLIVAATSLAALAMGFYLRWAHPRLRASMREYQDEPDD